MFEKLCCISFLSEGNEMGSFRCGSRVISVALIKGALKTIDCFVLNLTP